MAGFPETFIAELLDRNPIEDVVSETVQLTRRGSNMFGLCPFHAEKTPSFSITPDKNLFYCFGCHKGGSVINFIMERESLDYADAVRWLARRANMEVPEDGSAGSSGWKRRQQLQELCRDAARWFHGQLQGPAGEPGRAYLLGSRRLSSGTITRFGLGYAPEGWSGLLNAMTEKGYEKQDLLDAGLAVRGKNGSIYDRFRSRVMFPVIDVSGNVIGFGGRVLDDSTPKYLNSPESLVFNKRKNLFALNLAKKSKAAYLILTEGYMDAIALHQYGFDCAVASLGTALTAEQVSLLKKYTGQVILLYDTDEAGQDATRRANTLLENGGLQVRVLRMQGAKDPDEFLKEYGAERFRRLLDSAENYAEHQLAALQSRYDLRQDEQKVEFLQEAVQLIAGLSSQIEREIYAGRAAEAAGVTQQAVLMEVEKLRRTRARREKKQEERQNLSPAASLQPKSRDLHYDCIRSASAEEEVLRQVLAEPALFEQLDDLDGSDFSVQLLGRAYDALREQYRTGMPVQAGTLGGDFTAEEMAHLASVIRREETVVSEKALRDCRETILHEERRRAPATAENLLDLQNRYRQKKGYGG